MTTATATPPAPTAVPAPKALADLGSRLWPAGAEATGYMLSTLELSAGLDVQPLSLATLPDETLRELLRLRGSWRAPGRELA